MRSYTGLAFAFLLGAMPVAFAQPPAAGSQGGTAIRRSALEVIPQGLLGTWKLDRSASSYQTTAPKAQIRVFDYTGDGKLLVEYVTFLQNGRQTDGNWSVRLDGSPGIEYTRSYGSTPFAVVTLKQVNETSFYLTAARYGKVFEAGTFTLSQNASVLTFRYQQGNKHDVAVYRRWNTLD
jgi:hypothetical protein